MMASLKDKVVLITGAGDVAGIGAATALHMIQFQPKLVLTGRNSDNLDRVGKLVEEAGLPKDRVLGIGAATALHMIQFQPKLVLTGRNSDNLDRVGKLVEEAGLPKDRLLLVIADVTVDGDLERLVETAVNKFKQLDVLINNAAAITYHGTLETSMEEFDLIMRTNIRAPFYLSKLCLPHLIKTKGNIVNVSSISGQRTFCGEAAYGVSKAGLDHFTRIFAMEMAKHGVRANSVNPAVIRTRIQQKGGMSPEQYAEYAENQKLKHPLGHIGEPIDVAKAITFLASNDSSFITGELIFVDGGRHSMPV